jgi:cyclophilin family peptidyl-prolyl cis-trans isomerase/HEAT repeat protein
MTRPVPVSGWTVALAWLAAGACATAPPPPAAPVQTYEQKLAAIVRLEDVRAMRDPAPPLAPVVMRRGRAVAQPAPPPPPDLEAFLRDADARVRRRAALAIGRVGLAEGVAPLVAALADPDPEVRAMAAFGLGLLRDRTAVAPLVAALGDADARVQGRAAEALGVIGDRAAAEPVGRLVAALATGGAAAGLDIDEAGRPDSPLAPAARAFALGVVALVRLQAWEPLAAAVLDQGGQPRVRWWPVAWALQRIGDRRAVPALLAFASGPGVEAVLFAARGLGELKEASAVRVLLPLVDPGRRERRVVAQAIRALGQIGRPEAAPRLLEILASPDLDNALRVEAIDALGAIRAPEALDDLLDAMGHPAPAVRGAALRAVAAVDPATFVTVLSGLDPDPAWQVRVDLADALGRLDRERALARLGELLGDGDQRVVAAALRALAALKAPGLAATLRDHLTRDDVAVRATAAALLGELAPPGGEAWLAAAWERGRGDASYVARAAALGALAKYGAEAARGPLQAALADRDWAVRVRAAALLKTLDPGADTSGMRPAPTVWTEADYRQIVSPPYSPHVYVETTKGTIEIELAVLDAPLTALNFMVLARKGFFDGLAIHRVEPHFVAQLGDPRGDGEGGPGYTIRDELNDRPYLRGTVGMALDWADTGGSQFFITYGPQPHLDGRYTVFGHVVQGMDVVDRLERWDVVTRVRVWDGVTQP